MSQTTMRKIEQSKSQPALIRGNNLTALSGPAPSRSAAESPTPFMLTMIFFIRFRVLLQLVALVPNKAQT
jgi:hypothetical protein